jgi:drug/metabolite transporter superfamily protein YnfA
MWIGWCGGCRVYGIIPTFQADPHFGRVYAASGGVFIFLSLPWVVSSVGLRLTVGV